MEIEIRDYSFLVWVLFFTSKCFIPFKIILYFYYISKKKKSQEFLLPDFSNEEIEVSRTNQLVEASWIAERIAFEIKSGISLLPQDNTINSNNSFLAKFSTLSKNSGE